MAPWTPRDTTIAEELPLPLLHGPSNFGEDWILVVTDVFHFLALLNMS